MDIGTPERGQGVNATPVPIADLCVFAGSGTIFVYAQVTRVVTKVNGKC
ncbi:MAG: hypothetical protein IPP14_04005 [Planctomycetes bacterium]|nr:hypothetical protein [Planctomycetota bacterium]